MTAIADHKVVAFHYTLTSDEGEQLDSSDGGEPLLYMHGAGNIVPGLEKAMTGKVVGDKFETRVEPAEGYGEREGQPVAIPRSNFPPDAQLQTGMRLIAEDEAGNPFPIWILAIQDEGVVVDPNHPLAGTPLNFAIEVTAIRDATAEEMAHGHPHGPTGHEGHHH